MEPVSQGFASAPRRESEYVPTAPADARPPTLTIRASRAAAAASNAGANQDAAQTGRHYPARHLAAVVLCAVEQDRQRGEPHALVEPPQRVEVHQPEHERLVPQEEPRLDLGRDRRERPDALGRAGFVGNFEYWFPRPNSTQDEKQLVILGGAREEATKDKGYEFYVTDDSVINPNISKILKKFLPAVFPGKFETGTEPEKEWVSGLRVLVFFSVAYARPQTGIMGYTKTREPFVRYSTTILVTGH